MAYPHLVFCPYLPMPERVTFADWELGPLEFFEDRWADDHFKCQATDFLRHFVGTDNKPINNPVLLCRKGKRLDGQQPTRDELTALELSLAFAFIDRNPRRRLSGNHHDGSQTVTADNVELQVWPIDLESGHVTKSCGSLVSTMTGGYRIGDPDLVFSPPLGLNSALSARTPDCRVLSGIYETVLQSLSRPTQGMHSQPNSNCR